MCMLVVGGDSISQIKDELEGVGFTDILHWNARRKSVSHKKIPERVECVLMLTSYLNHPVMKKIKDSAKKRNIPSLYAKRNRLDVRDALRCTGCPEVECLMMQKEKN
jgi:hypothetical protein